MVLKLPQEAILFLVEYTALVSFLGGVISEDVLLFFLLVFGTQAKQFLIVCSFGFLGAMLHDVVLYAFAQSAWAWRWRKRWRIGQRSRIIIAFLEKLGGKGYVIPLMFSKFVYGTRVPVIFYAANKERSIARFILMNAYALAVWFAVMIPIVWFASKGFYHVLSAVQEVERALGLVILGILVIYGFNRLIRKIVLRYQKYRQERNRSRAVT